MTQEEYKKEKERTDEYERLNARKNALLKSRENIDDGILSIECAYHKIVNFTYNEIKEKIQHAIYDIYCEEIERICNQLEEV